MKGGNIGAVRREGDILRWRERNLYSCALAGQHRYLAVAKLPAFRFGLMWHEIRFSENLTSAHSASIHCWGGASSWWPSGFQNENEHWKFNPFF